MKSEKEFLDGMWRTVRKIEREEAQKETARANNRRIGLQSVLLYLTVILLFTAVLIFYRTGNLLNSTYVIAVVLLVAAYFAEKYFTGGYYEHRNYN